MKSNGCVALCLWAAVGIGCDAPPGENLKDSSRDSDGSESQETGNPTGSAEGTDTGNPSLEGRWGLRVTGASKQVGLPLLKTAIVVSDSFYLVEARLSEPGIVRTKETACATYMRDDTGLFKTTVPAAFAEHAAVIERRVEVGDGGVGAPWRSDNVYSVYGARLKNRETDPLPISFVADRAAFACDEVEYGEACDQDRDGYPGVTFITTGVLGCKLYFASRINVGLDGVILNRDRISGPLWASGDETSLLDASTQLCRSMAMKNVSVLDECPELFTFAMVRLDGDADCGEVMALTTCDEGHPACVGETELPLNPPEAAAGDCAG